MASAPSDPRAVLGRLDASGRLIAADAELEALQKAAGASLNEPLALPQIAAIARLARELGTAVSRSASAASADHDIDLWVHAVPHGDEIALSLDRWARRPAAGPRLASILGGGSDATTGEARNRWAVDEELRIVSLTPDLADLLGVRGENVAGQPLTRVVRLEEDAAGDMPLIAALAGRKTFSGQRARSRAGAARSLTLSGEVVTGADGEFAGFRGSVDPDRDEASSAASPARRVALDQALDNVLRSPLDRIIETAERIVERADGPLRSDYATYGHDIAAAARHLLSVVGSMNETRAPDQSTVDLTALAAEAIVMLDPSLQERGIAIESADSGPLNAIGEERAVTQILVNLIGNAILYSPANARIAISFARGDGSASVTVADQGPGIDAADQQRIFERFERAQSTEGGTGLGLAISRRLARSLGGDVTLDSALREGARFTLTLPAG